MKEIVAVDQNWGIGYGGKLLKPIPGDMARFRKMTLHKVVVMGRETFESLPKREPLKDRVNIVLSRNPDYRNDRVTVCRSLDELFGELKKYDTDDVFVIGGGAVYALLLPYCTEAYVTKIENAYPADTYFPKLDEADGWRLVSEQEPMGYQDIEYRYTLYANGSPKTSWRK
jgi:dihydrofolate reductase